MNLLTLSEARVAQERRRAEQVAHYDRRSRRRILCVVLWSLMFYGVGVWLLGLSFHVENRDYAQALLYSGLLVGNFGPLVVGYVAWVREHL